MPMYTVCLCVKQLNKNITMFFNVKNLPLAPQYRKRRLQITCNTISMRNIHNHLELKNQRDITTSDGSGATFMS